MNSYESIVDNARRALTSDAWRVVQPVLVRQEGKTSIPWGAHIGIRPIEADLHRFDEKGTPMR